MKNVEDEYNFIKQLGNGAFGSVFLGENKKTKEKVAIKKINHKNMNDSQKIKVKNEVTNMMMMKCRNSIEFKDMYKDAEYYYIIMELCDCNLEEYIKNKEGEEGLNSLQVLPILNQLNNAFEIMVKNGIIHGDLKADNILIKYIDPEKKNFIVKISDFGLSYELSNTGYANNHIGNIYTAAPEIFSNKSYNNKCDLWSIGCIIYFMKFKKYPFSGKNQILKGEYFLPKIKIKRMEDLIRKLLVVDPNKRIGWEEYFNHDYFKIKIKNLLSKFSEIETELKRFTKKDEYTYVGDVKLNSQIRHGHGICYYNNGDRYEGEFKDDKIYGKGTFYPSINNYEIKDYSSYNGDKNNIYNVDKLLLLLSALFSNKNDNNNNYNHIQKTNSFTMDLSQKLSNIPLSTSISVNKNDNIPKLECVVTNENEKKFAEKLTKNFNYIKPVKYAIKQTKSDNKPFEVRLVVNGEKNIISKKFINDEETLNSTLNSIYNLLNKKYEYYK